MHCHGCRVIRMSLIVSFDPNPISLSRLDSLSFFRGPSHSKHSCFFWRVWGWHMYVPSFCCNISLSSLSCAIINITLDMWNSNFPCEMYLAQSHRMHSSFHHIPSLRWYFKKKRDMLLKRDTYLTSKYIAKICCIQTCLQQVCSYLSKYEHNLR